MTERTQTDMTDQHDETKPTWTAPAPVAAPPAAPPATPASAAPMAPQPASPATPTMTVPVAPVTPVVTTQRKKSGAWVNVLLGVAAVIAIGGVAFAIGRSTAPASAATTGRFPNGFQGGTFPGGSFDPGAAPNGSFDPGAFPGGGRGGFGGGLTIDGTVQSIDGTTMTIKLASGDTTTVTLDGSTAYHQSTSATSSDVAVGDDVAVRVSGGGRFVIGNGNGNGNANGNGNGNGANRDLTASDVTVSK